MIIAKSLVRLLLDGRKTQARFPVSTVPGGTIRPCRYRPGRSYTVQRAVGDPQVARVEVLAVRRELLGAIDYAGARAEGHRTVVEFADAWMCQYDRRWPPTVECEACDGEGMRIIRDEFGSVGNEGCVTCEGSGALLVEVTEEDLRARFTERHADTLVWVVTFRLDDAPRLLTARPSSVEDRGVDADSDHGYTTNRAQAMADEPEAIDAGLLEVYTQDAHARFAGQPGRREDQLRRRARSLANRLRQAAVGPRAPEVAAQLEQIEAAVRLLEGQRRGAA